MPNKPSLIQEAGLKQKTVLTPLQIQEIRILEYPTLELEQRIEKELEENPGLERGTDESEEHNADDNLDGEDTDPLKNEDFDLDDYISDDDVPDYRLHTTNTSADDKREDIPFAVGQTFHEYLLSQLGLLPISGDMRKVAQYVIGNIDENGYLRRDAESLVDDLVFHANITVSDDEMRHIIRLIQETFEPAGVCAHNLQECLLIQLRRKQPSLVITLAISILEKRYKEFTAHHYSKIMERLGITEEQLRQAITEITRLTPKPGNAWSNDMYTETTVIPDFIVETEGGQPLVSLNNGNIPELRVNSEFNRILQDYQNQTEHTRQEKDTVSFIKDRIDSARWFIDAIRQRNETLIRTMRAIVNVQRDFFIEGDETLLKPMILKDIADKTGYDISTISRVSNSKYVQTDFGVFPLKFFFSESMTNNEGEEVATRAIKNTLVEMIAKEDKQKPLNDDELVAALQQKGFVLARRTVAKYRKQLHIPVARLRKTL
ncbi:MAG: RNA polymerase factor sigma-54 [Paludibacter sp.]|nr:RNA polymerase factor sigma-54 [Bacteroidales bacterium]MCM1069440.1 RNA polymerase factor sigma-54 [Prevotella sp.]MCM1353814.1 RNA polymerase factor sigma-54 [Bacteroides sp.]MCM1442785.1 RNA polymerase factor sigma-54 [Muribaculum sp.]MCM1481849.1 RNA polymerase factor sigma-54 [Paludibacter sp.]